MRQRTCVTLGGPESYFDGILALGLKPFSFGVGDAGLKACSPTERRGGTAEGGCATRVVADPPFRPESWLIYRQPAPCPAVYFPIADALSNSALEKTQQG